MLDPADRQTQPEPFTREVLARLPLAEAVLLLWSHILQPSRLAGIFQQHRGRSFEDMLSFPTFVELIADALIQHRGSARQSLLHAQTREHLPTTPRAVYGKLARIPTSLSLGFLEETTAAMEDLWPSEVKAAALPASLDGITVVHLDGKTIKRAAKRLKPSSLTQTEVVNRLRELLSGLWSPLWIKSVNKKPRPAKAKAKAKAKGSGAHTSVHRMLQAHQKQSISPTNSS